MLGWTSAAAISPASRGKRYPQGCLSGARWLSGTDEKWGVGKKKKKATQSVSQSLHVCELRSEVREDPNVPLRASPPSSQRAGVPRRENRFPSFLNVLKGFLFTFPFHHIVKDKRTDGRDRWGWQRWGLMCWANTRASLSLHQTSRFSAYVSRVNHTPRAWLQIWMRSQKADIITRQPLFLCKRKDGSDSPPLFLIMGLKICQKRRDCPSKSPQCHSKVWHHWKNAFACKSVCLLLLLYSNLNISRKHSPNLSLVLDKQSSFSLLVRRTDSGLLHQSLSKSWSRYRNISVLRPKLPSPLSMTA